MADCAWWGNRSNGWRENPDQNRQPYEKLVGDLTCAISYRIDIQDRLVYQVH
jgi:toxin YoeB